MQRSRQRVTRDEVVAERGVVATARAESAAAGIAMLEAGGTAVDAAVAVGFAAGVVEPMDTCIAGSGFMLVHEGSSGEAWSVEFPPRAPLAARPDLFEVVEVAGPGGLLGIAPVRDDANVDGYLAPGVPGTVAGLCLAHRRFGRLPLAQVLEPAIALAQDGFEVDGYYALQALLHLDVLRRHPEAAATFLVDGLPPVPAFMGRASLGVPPRIRQANLAETLRRIAREGAQGFYAGEVAAAIEEDFRSHGGLLTRQDFAAYQATVVRPLTGSYRGTEVLVPRSPGGGWTVLQLLGLLERLVPQGRAHGDPEVLHALAEASRHAFADRYHHFADPDVEPVPLRGALSAPYLDELAALVEPGRARLQDLFSGLPWQRLASQAEHDPWRHDPAGPVPPKRFAAAGAGAGAVAGSGAAGARHGTTHFCVIDAEGNTASCTHTAANAFGSSVVAAGTGVLFDSAMVWFNPLPGTANSVAPGKRPLVNMAPALVRRDGKPHLAVGAPGGRRIASAVTQVITNVVDHGMSPQQALDAPRIDASGPAALVSARIPQEARHHLEAAGHRLVVVDEEHEPYLYEFARPVAAMVRPDGRLTGGIDPFTTGTVAGL